MCIVYKSNAEKKDINLQKGILKFRCKKGQEK